MVAFGTDGAIVADDLVVMDDDKHLFPPYQVAPVVRLDALKAQPAIGRDLNRVAPLLTDADDAHAQQRDRRPQKREPADVAHDFIKQHGLVSA